MSNTPTTYTRRKGRQNKSSHTVRLALSSMKFDAVKEWIKAYQELNTLSAEDAYTQLEIIKTKFKSLEKLFEHMYPKLKEIDQDTADQIDMEAIAFQDPLLLTPVEEQETAQLLESLNGPKI